MGWTWQTSSLGGSWTSGPGAVLQSGDRLVVFAKGTDNAIWHKWQTSSGGSWSGWESLGGYLTSDPACALNAPGGLVVFARGTDNAIWHKWQGRPDGDWSGWESLEGEFASGPSALLQTGGRLVVFARGTDNQIWHRWQVSRNGDWSGWEALGGVLTSDPACALNAPGGLVVFARGTDNAIWHKWQGRPDGDWSDWESLAGDWTSGPTAVLLPNGRLSVLARGMDNQIWQRSQTSTNGNWDQWAATGSRFRPQSDPDATLNTAGQPAVFALTTGDAMGVTSKVWVQDPPQLTVVPRLEGLLDSQVGPLLEAANLQYGAVWNPTKEHHTDRLRVISQDPAAGDSVPVGTRVNYSVELAHQQQGVKSIVLTNAHQQGRAVEVFLWDSSVGGWSSQGNLGVDASVTLSLASGRIYTVVAVDRGLVNCTDGRPDNVSCQRLLWGARGDASGLQIPLTVV